MRYEVTGDPLYKVSSLCSLSITDIYVSLSFKKIMFIFNFNVMGV
jgi:hypothetical protein